MRTLNLRLLAVLLVGALLAGGAVHWIHGIQVRRHAGLFLEKARQAKGELNFEESLRHFSSYLSLAPNDAEALAEYGLLLANLSRDREALESLEKALRHLPDRSDVRRRLVDVNMRIRRYSDAQEHIRRLLKEKEDSLKGKEDGELFALLGRCQTVLGQYADAEKSYQRTIDLAPDHLDAFPARADLLRNRLNRAQEADDWMEELVKAHANSARAQLLYAEYLRGKGDIDAAARWVAKVLEKSPDDLAALTLAARTAAEKGQYDEARKHAAHALDVDPKNVAAYRMLAQIESGSGQPEQAVAWLRKGIEILPGHWELLWDMTRLQTNRGATQEAAAWLEKLQKVPDVPEGLLAYLLARTQCVPGHWSAARRALDEVRPRLTPWPEVVGEVDYWLARCYGQLGDPDQQIAAYGRAVSANPLGAVARLGLASALASAGKIDEALDEFGKTRRMKGAPAEVEASIARLLIRKELGKDLVARDWKPAAEAVDRLVRAAPESAEAVLLPAEFLTAQNRRAEAEKILEAARKRKPERIEFWLGQVEVILQERAWDRAAALLQETQNRFGDKVPIRLARARMVVRQHGPQGAAALRSLAAGGERFSDAERLALWRGLADAARQIDDFAAAQTFAQRAAEKDPDDLAVRMLLFELALRNGNDSDMERILGEIGSIEGQGPYWHYGHALRSAFLAEKRKDDRDELLAEAEKHAAAARALRPAWSRLAALTADLSLARGNPVLALENYLHAVDLGDRSPALLRRTIELLYRQGREKEAGEILRRMEKQGTSSSELNRLDVQLALRLEDFDRAQEKAEKAAAASKDYRDFMEVAAVLGMQAQRAKAAGHGDEAAQSFRDAEAALRQSLQQAPGAPAAWLSLIHFLAAAGRATEAEKALAEGKQKVPRDQVPLFTIEGHQAMGHNEEASRLYEAAIAKAPGDAALIHRAVEFYRRAGKRENAELHLKRILAEGVKTGDTETAWARRQLASLLASHRNYPDLRQALVLIDQNLKTQADARDRRARALLLAGLPVHEGRDEALRTLEDLLAKHPEFLRAEDRLLLAQLYGAKGDGKKAREIYRSLILAHDKEPRFLAAYVESVLREKDPAEAELWIKRLEELAPRERATTALQSELDFQRGRHAETIARLEDALAAPATSRVEQPPRWFAVAEALESFARRLTAPDQKTVAVNFSAAAESVLRRHLKEHGEDSMWLAAFLARQNRLDDALRAIEQAPPSAPPPSITEAAAAILSTKAATPHQLSRLDAVVTSALAKHGRIVPLLLCLAELRTAQERFADAERLYREILGQDGRNAFAENNLAVLLALQDKNLDEALALIEKAIAASGPIPAFLDTRATVYLAQGKFPQALEDMAAVIIDAPRAVFYFHQAQAYQQSGQRAPAVGALVKAKELALKPEDLHPLEREAYRKLTNLSP